jgi:hypothetical protein
MGSLQALAFAAAKGWIEPLKKESKATKSKPKLPDYHKVMQEIAAKKRLPFSATELSRKAGPATPKQISIPKEWLEWSEPVAPVKNSPEPVVAPKPIQETDKPAAPKVAEPETPPKPTISPEKEKSPEFKEYIVTAPDGEQVIITD